MYKQLICIRLLYFCLCQVAPAPPTARVPQPATQPVVQSRNESQYEFVVNRQKEFKLAALAAKKDGDIETAREYLRQSKVSIAC